MEQQTEPLRVRGKAYSESEAGDRDSSVAETDVGTSSDQEAPSSCSEEQDASVLAPVRDAPLVPRFGRAARELSEAERAERQVKAILNKLTRERFEGLFAQLLECCCHPGAAAGLVEAVACEVFSKATTQPTLVQLYADLCARLHAELGQGGQEAAFKRALLGECQRSFHEHLAPPAIDESLGYAEHYEALVKYKTRMLGNARLVGHLVLRRMLSPKVALFCVDELLAASTPEALETLCALLSTVGPVLDVPGWPGHARLVEAFAQVEDLSRCPERCPRIRCLLRDLVDLRLGGWASLRDGAQVAARESAAATAPACSRPDRLRSQEAATHEPAAAAAHLQCPRVGGRGMREAAARATASAPPRRAVGTAANAVARQRTEAPPTRGGAGENKFLCRFLVGIEETQQFAVCRRLIGPGGQHMKTILAAAGDAKIRVRGRGSKYLEGPNKVESSDPLMVCVSATSRPVFERAATMVEELLAAVHKEYLAFCLSRGLPAPQLAVRREVQRSQ